MFVQERSDSVVTCVSRTSFVLARQSLRESPSRQIFNRVSTESQSFHIVSISSILRSVSLANTAGDSALSLCVKNAHEVPRHADVSRIVSMMISICMSQNKDNKVQKDKTRIIGARTGIICIRSVSDSQACLETMLRAGAPVNVSNRTTGAHRYISLRGCTWHARGICGIIPLKSLDHSATLVTLVVSDSGCERQCD